MAGGVVGMARTAEMNGFKRVIGFDMGGIARPTCRTSTANMNAISKRGSRAFACARP